MIVAAMVPFVAYAGTLGAPRAHADTTAGGGGVVAVSRARLTDTRPGAATVDGVLAGGGVVGAGGVVEVPVLGRGGVPSVGVAAVVVNVTAVEPSASSFVTVWPSGEPRPNASSLNVVAGDVAVPNVVMAKVGVGGRISLFNESGSVDLIVDVSGYVATAGGGTGPGGSGSPGGLNLSGAPFVGTAQVVVRRDHFCGFGAGPFQGPTQVHDLPVQVVVNPPRSFVDEFGITHVEENPINLYISVGPPTVNGAVEISSGAIIGPGQLTNRAIFRYWALTLAGTNLTGTLIDDFAEAAVARNLLNAPRELVACNPQFGTMIWPEVIAEGSTLAGTITNTSVELQVRGNVSTLLRPFTVTIQAGR